MSQDYKKNYVSLYGNSDDDEVDEDSHSNKLNLVDKLNQNTVNTTTGVKDICEKDKDGQNGNEDTNTHKNDKTKLISSLNNNNNNNNNTSTSTSTTTTTTNNNNNHNHNNDDVTPSILLEQLAYVDNFLPNVNNDFMNLNNWILNENNQNNTHMRFDNNSNIHSSNNVSDSINTTNTNNNNHNTSSPSSAFIHNPFMLDEQLAAELSAFADDVFIFPDEDKPKLNNNSNNNNNSNKDDANANINENIQNNTHNTHNNKKKNSHYLSQRRNTFLTSQYDYSKSRFSSKKDNKLISTNTNNNNSDNLTTTTNDNNNTTNIEVSTFSPEVSSTIVNQFNNNNGSIIDTHNITSISNLTNQNSSNSLPISTPNNNNSSSSNNSSNTISQIQVPDYSKISTESLVALLPRVTIPQSVNDLLIKSGLTNDQIISLSAIMAYHQQKQHLNNNSSSSIKDYDRAKLLNQLNQLHDANPIKSCSIVLFQLVDNIESQNNKSVTKPQDVHNHSNKDEILSLIEASNREVNELKAKLDKKIIKTQKLKQEMNNLMERTVVDQHINSNSLPNNHNHIHIQEFKPIFNNHSHNRTNQTDIPATSKPLNNKRKRSALQSGIDRNNNNNTNIKQIETSINHNSISQIDSNKKQKKEKELETTIQQLGNLANSLQNRIQSLESENELLKEFLISFTGEIGGAEKMESIKQKLLKKIQKD